MESEGQGRSAHRGWTMWLAVWLATVGSSGLAVLGSWQLTSETFEVSLEGSLHTQVQAQAAMAAASLDPVPLESVVAVGGGRSMNQLRDDLRQIRDIGGLHEVALLGPAGAAVTVEGRPWIPQEADAALIASAATGEPASGPLYQGADGEIYLAAYAPLPHHPGWVAAVESSGAPLEAAERMEAVLAGVSALVMLLAAAVGAMLAATALRPLRRLERDLGSVEPGDDPDAVGLAGPAEVRLVAAAARSLLQAVRDRDVALRLAHDREVRQVSALAAAVAHEVRNPLNAVGLAMDRLERVPVTEAGALRARVRVQLDEIEGIVERFMDLARPPEPHVAAVRSTRLWQDLAVDAEAVGVEIQLPDEQLTLTTDPSLVRQATRNLLRNAAEAGARTVRVEVVGRSPVVIELSDDGPGISPQQVDALFDWFATTRAQGSGLGLPSARRALRAVGGELELVSPAGARFRLILEGVRP
ncbi:MAG: hypothetical protein H6742_10160 [Alphaproteobacteria bacterium]|nr:hypothetical protein [Alphaproteobacteria bacterium]